MIKDPHEPPNRNKCAICIRFVKEAADDVRVDGEPLNEEDLQAIGASSEAPIPEPTDTARPKPSKRAVCADPALPPNKMPALSMTRKFSTPSPRHKLPSPARTCHLPASTFESSECVQTPETSKSLY